MVRSDGASSPGGQASGRQLPPGIALKRVLSGHTAEIRCLAFDRDGETLASGGDDFTVRAWDVATGRQLRALHGHGGAIYSVVFDSKSGTLVSGGDDDIVRVWDVASGRLLRSLRHHGCRGISSIAIDPQGRTVICGGMSRTVVWDLDNWRLRYELQPTRSTTSLAFAPNGEWFARVPFDGPVDLIDVSSGRVFSSLAEGKGPNFSGALDPSGRTLAIGDESGTIFLWSVSNGQLLRKLEGHTFFVGGLAYAPDGSLLASKSNDQTIRLWNCATWETVAIIPAPMPRGRWIRALAFLPNQIRNRAVLATASSSPTETTDDQLCREIHLYELDLEVLLRNTSPRGVKNAGESNGRAQSPSEHQTVHSATAKIVLVGDSGVGKTGLGWRLSHSEYREHDSTHGQQFWVLNQLATTRQDGTQCEAVLWDLAGQPDYRLIHALSIQDADLALIVFDPTNGRDPLGSAEYWLRQLPAACPKILVAARIDRGTPVLTDAELDAFCQRVGIAGGCIKTSARENGGVDELLERIKKTIQWDLKTAVSTDAMFKRIKDFVLTLKESRTRKQVLYTPAELRNALVESRSTKRRPGKKHTHKASDIQDSTASLTDVQLLTAVRNLSSQGFVRLVTHSSGEERILLVPELLNNLAASIVLEARRNERGLGAVEEGRLFDGSYRFRELEPLSDSDCNLLLDATVEAFLSNRLSYRCFREHAGSIKLIIFPDLMNLKKPQRDDLITEDGASYILSGATENTFAGLVVLLGYTNLFARTDQAHDVAWFESPRGEICAVRQIREDNERTILLMFGRDTTPRIRSIFEGLVEQMLSTRDTHIRRVRPVKCQNCQTPVDRAVMARRLKSGKSKSFCEECGTALVLPPDEPLSVKPDQRRQIAEEGSIAERRTRFEEILFEMTRLAKTQNLSAPTCFISYAWGDAAQEHWVEQRLATDLDKASIPVILDRWDNSQPGSSVARFVDRVSQADKVLIVGTTRYLSKYENRDPNAGTVVAAEMDLVSARLLGTEQQKQTVIPLLLEGEKETAFPPALRTRVYSDFRNEDRYFEVALELLLSLYNIGPRDAAAVHWKRQLQGDAFQRRVFVSDADDEDLPTDDEMRQALKRVGSRALNAAFDAQQPVVVEQHGKLVWLYSDGTAKPYVAADHSQPGVST